MFWHVFKYRLKCLVRDRGTVFWTMIFPLILATLFYFSFGHLTSLAEEFEPIPTAVVNNEAYESDTYLRKTLEALSQPGPNQFLQLTVAEEGEALRLLNEGRVYGIIQAANPVRLTVKQKGFRQTILKSFLDQYSQTKWAITEIARQNPATVPALIGAADHRREFTQQIWFSQAKQDTNLGFFYALIAMTCLYSSFWGLRNTLHLQADLSPQGARRSTAPTHKKSVVLSDTLAALAISFAEVLILLAYLRFALQISFGSELGLILLLTLAGCLCGVSLGYAAGTLIPGDEGAKNGILIAFNMLASFLAGLMWAPIKDTVARKAPLVARLNPAALIADSFYSLHIYHTYQRFFLNLGSLVLISLVLGLISFHRLRRERYASL
ncbi:MAG TPA: ABC transporter permease [Firmicutes bacterium]|nr:ABC transporter permease [Bacillota bacterium]